MSPVIEYFSLGYVILIEPGTVSPMLPLTTLLPSVLEKRATNAFPVLYKGRTL